MLLDKIQSSRLQNSVEAVRTAVAANQDAFNFTDAASFLGSQIDSKPAGRAVGAVGTSGEADIMDDSGNIRTGYYSNWWKLSEAQRAKVEAERKRIGANGPGKGRNGGRNRNPKSNKKYKNRIKKLERQVKALKKRTKTEENNDSEDDSGENDEGGSSTQAGTAFGGRNEHQKKKKKKTA